MYTTTNDTYVHGLYHDVLDEDEATAYLEGTDVYNSDRKIWLVPDVQTNMEALVDALCVIIKSVMKRFVKTNGPGVERHLVNTQGHAAREEKGENGYGLYPVLAVCAAGPSFQIPASLRDTYPSQPQILPVGYPGMATFFTVQHDSDPRSDDERIKELETYARYVLRDQPNRRFARALILSESFVRLAHFDRAGTELTPPFDMHKLPVTFIRLVAGLCSGDEGVLGIDTSIQWTIVNGRKSVGTLTTTGTDGRSKAFRILERLSTPRTEIRGRATTCWRVQDPDTLQELIVKDSWRPDDRRPEYELLELCKGIPGVVQMLSYDPGRGEIRHFRCTSTLGSFENRVATRVMTKAYGRSIQEFTSADELLCAMRDAIAGHRSLVGDDVQILHRDISPQNVLLGLLGAPVGERGVIIDFDLAFHATPSRPVTKANYNIGLRIFQSLSVLSSSFNKQTPSHDYLDDLQSFFFTLVYILLLYGPDGTCLPITDEGPSLLLSWDDDDAGDAFTKKQRIISGGPLKFRVSRLIRDSWGPALENLFDKFQAWTLSRRAEKEKLVHQKKGSEHLLPKRDEYYSAVLEMFDQAIEAIKSSQPIPSLEPALQFQHVSNQNHRQPGSIPLLRRSARIRHLLHPKNDPPPAALPTQAPWHTKTPAYEPRRSARIQKRRLEEDEGPDLLDRPKVSRVAKGSRVTRRCR